MFNNHYPTLLGVSGDLKFRNLDNEDFDEGIDEFFTILKKRIYADKIIFLMDMKMKMSVAHEILEKWNNRAIIILQSHCTWGDVFMYFLQGGWFTLHLRTDAFSWNLYVFLVAH